VPPAPESLVNIDVDRDHPMRVMLSVAV
jgi:hypothetical protein